jgi:hypothetical protein
MSVFYHNNMMQFVASIALAMDHFASESVNDCSRRGSGSWQILTS